KHRRKSGPNALIFIGFLLSQAACGGDAGGPSGPNDDDGSGPGVTTLPATATLTGGGDPCALPAPTDEVWANLRPDVWLPQTRYDEPTEPPPGGGRVQLVGVAQASGTVSRVTLGGVDLETLTAPPDPTLEWHHVWPTELVAGEPVWLAFHSRSTGWNAASQAEVAITVGDGPGAQLALQGQVPVAQGPLRIQYVTTSADRQALWLHVHNASDAEQTLSGVWVNGRDVQAGGVLEAPSATLTARETALWRVPMCEAMTPGAAWTVAARTLDGPAAVAAGRVMPPRFPFATWNNSSECPFPSAKADNLAAMQAVGLDTFYLLRGQSNCSFDRAALLGAIAGQTPNFHLMASSDFVTVDGLTIDPAGVSALITGDESDGEIYDPDGIPRPAKKAAKTRASWAAAPAVPTFNGGKTNKNIGTFAGMSDIQGMDFYIGACPPHITTWQPFDYPHLEAPFDYLRNARNNHIPLPTWAYTQGLSPAWNRNGNSIQAEPNAILVQAMMAAAAGAKGLLWFQSNLKEAERHPDSWAAIAQANRMLRAVAPWLRQGDPADLADSTDPVLVEAIQASDALIVPVISLDASGPTDLGCLGAEASADLTPRWRWRPQQAAIRVTVPARMALAQVYEVRPDGNLQPYEGTVRADLATRQVTLTALTLDETQPARLLVFSPRADL
ncbi:MAG: hypothetical protein ACPGUV_13005, partial [Polyangiales bacterium]